MAVVLAYPEVVFNCLGFAVLFMPVKSHAAAPLGVWNIAHLCIR